MFEKHRDAFYPGYAAMIETLNESRRLADWKFEIATADEYEVEIQQGCGEGSGGAEVIVEISGQILTVTVQDTGHFQHMIQRTIGQVKLAAAKHTLAVKPHTKPDVAVMDLGRVVLRRAP